MDLRSQLQAIYDAHGQLTPRLVLDTARDPEHPLHPRFDWNDKTAGEAWRLHQARRLISVVRVTYADNPSIKKGHELRAFYAVPVERKYSFEPLQKVVSDPQTRQLLIDEMKREWKALKRRYDEFDEFWRMVAADLDEREGESDLNAAD
jgi:hypothetical protein